MKIIDFSGLDSAKLGPDEYTIVFTTRETDDMGASTAVQVQLDLSGVRTASIARLVEALALRLRVQHL